MDQPHIDRLFLIDQGLQYYFEFYLLFGYRKSEVYSVIAQRHFFHLVVFHEYFINQKLHTWLLYVPDIYSRVEFSRDPSRGFFSPYVRNCASKCLLGFFFGFFQRATA